MRESLRKEQLLVHKRICVLDVLGILMPFAPALALPRFKISAVAAPSAGAIVAPVVMALEIRGRQHPHLVVTCFKALRTQAARLSRSTIGATIYDGVF